MDTNSQNPAPVIDQQMPRHPQGSASIIVGIVIIVLILSAGGFYFWTMTSGGLPTVSVAPHTPAPEESDPIVTALTNTSSKDTASALEADLSNTDTAHAADQMQVQ